MRRPPRPCACSRPARTATHRSSPADPAGAATAGLIAAALDPDLRQALDLGAASRVLVIGSEGATDPLIYRQTVGRAPEEIARCEPQF